MVKKWHEVRKGKLGEGLAAPTLNPSAVDNISPNPHTNHPQPLNFVVRCLREAFPSIMPGLYSSSFANRFENDHVARVASNL